MFAGEAYSARPIAELLVRAYRPLRGPDRNDERGCDDERRSHFGPILRIQIAADIEAH